MRWGEVASYQIWEDDVAAKSEFEFQILVCGLGKFPKEDG
jgi:hypothetical protein